MLKQGPGVGPGVGNHSGHFPAALHCGAKVDKLSKLGAQLNLLVGTPWTLSIMRLPQGGKDAARPDVHVIMQ